jgi:hypothetical protein
MVDSTPLPPESPEESIPVSKRQYLWIVRYLIPLILGGGFVWMLLYQAPWLLHNPNQQDIAMIRSQAVNLTQRVDHLEEMAKRPILSTVAPLKIKNMESALTGMQQKIENLQDAIARHSEGAPPQPSLQQDLTEPLEKDLHQLAQAQQILRSIILFWHLKEKILSGAPYMPDLIAYKAHTSGNGDLSSLEKHAVQGLGTPQKPIKQEPAEQTQAPLSPDQNQTGLLSWWQRLQASAKSLVSIEKIETSHTLPAPMTYDEQNRKSVEATLARLEQALIHQLTAISLPDLAASLTGDES